MFTKLDDFLASGVRPLMEGKERLHVLLATYSAVTGYDNGAVIAKKYGLTIKVQSGNLRYSPAGLFIGEIGCREAREAQSTMEASLKIETEETPLLVVVYAGYSAFNEAVAMVKKIKVERPAATIVMTMCDCGIDGQKTFVLSPMLTANEIEAAVVTGECAGRSMMREILEKIVDEWPVKIPA